MTRFMSCAFPIGALLLAACGSVIRMMPMHDPIYPAPNEKITFTLEEGWAGDGIRKISLFVRETPVTGAGPGKAGPEKLIGTFKPPGQPRSVKNHTVSSPGFAANRLVRYRFEIIDKSGAARSHSVEFATRTYPVPGKPAPVYAQGDVNKVLNVVFIPDDGLKTAAQMKAFRSECRTMLKEMLEEPTIGVFNGQFNFFINPVPGNATSWPTGNPHGKPANAAQISFAQTKAIVHDDKSLVNHGNNAGGYLSATINLSGAMRHESGHAMFNLADEYDGGGGYWQAYPLPNLWSTKPKAKAAAPRYGRDSSNIREVKGGSKSWWRLCDQCQMKNGYAPQSFDVPCAHRVVYVIVDRAVPGALKP